MADNVTLFDSTNSTMDLVIATDLDSMSQNTTDSDNSFDDFEFDCQSWFWTLWVRLRNVFDNFDLTFKSFD